MSDPSLGKGYETDEWRRATQLELECEQLLTALEDSQENVWRVAEERDQALARVAERECAMLKAERELAERNATLCELRHQVGQLQEQSKHWEAEWQSEHARATPYQKELTATIEELQVVTEGLEDSNERLRAALTTAERANAAKSHFLAAVSHDLRQPVQAATLLLGLLQKRSLEPPTRKLVDMTRVALMGLTSLLNGLLDLARLEAGILKPEISTVSLDELLQRLAVEFAGPARAAGLWLHVPSTLLAVSSDPLLLELILRNLIDNALKYTSCGGVTVQIYEQNGHAQLAVIDTGQGIPPEQLEAIFEEFHQLDNPARDRARGFGLGLATVKQVARLLGTHVRVHSELGRGSTFLVTVPRVPQTASPVPKPPCPVRADESAVLAGRSVLVVEDDPAVLTALKLLLSDWGLVIHSARSLRDVLAQLDQLDRPPNLIITDYRLPDGVRGSQVADRVRERWPVPVILLTGDTAPERLVEARQSGYWLLHKPVELEALKAVLLAAL
jgi:signal transduction histidine kinase